MNIFEKLINELLAAKHLKQVHDIVHCFRGNRMRTFTVHEYGHGSHMVRLAIPSDVDPTEYIPRGTGNPMRVGTFVVTGCEHLNWPISMNTFTGAIGADIPEVRNVWSTTISWSAADAPVPVDAPPTTRNVPTTF